MIRMKIDNKSFNSNKLLMKKRVPLLSNISCQLEKIFFSEMMIIRKSRLSSSHVRWQEALNLTLLQAPMAKLVKTMTKNILALSNLRYLHQKNEKRRSIS